VRVADLLARHHQEANTANGQVAHRPGDIVSRGRVRRELGAAFRVVSRLWEADYTVRRGLGVPRSPAGVPGHPQDLLGALVRGLQVHPRLRRPGAGPRLRRRAHALALLRRAGP